MLSLSIDFYVRVFVRVYTSPATVKDTPTKLAYVWQSRGCDSFFLQHVGRKVWQLVHLARRHEAWLGCLLESTPASHYLDIPLPLNPSPPAAAVAKCYQISV